MDYDGGFIMQKTVEFNRMNQRSTSNGKVKFQFQNGEVLGLKLYEHLRG